MPRYLPRVIGRYETTFGFELELASAPNETSAELVEAGVLQDPGYHRYHCSCGMCSDTRQPLRAQTDSTAAGELISGVMSFHNADSVDEFEHLIDALEQATAAAGATTSLSCGLHVHVGVPDLVSVRNRMIRSYAAVEEHIIRRLAPGRWSVKREMNRTIAQAVRHYSPQVAYERADRQVNYDRPADLIARAIQYDRHADLNFDFDRTGTVEYRMWNATMMAWRIELACRLSVFLATADLMPRGTQLAGPLQECVENGIDLLPATISWDDFVAAVALRDERCAELMHKQDAYLREAY